MLVSITKTGIAEIADEAVMAHFNLSAEQYAAMSSDQKSEKAECFVADKEGLDFEVGFERQIKALPVLSGVEVMAGSLVIDGHCFQIDFHAPIGATDVERDAAFMAALEEKGKIDYITIGAIAESPKTGPMHFPNASVPIPNLQTHYVIYSKEKNAFWSEGTESNPDGTWGDLMDACINYSPDLLTNPLGEGDWIWMTLEDATKINVTEPAEVMPVDQIDEVPQSGPEMMRVALERVLSASTKGYLKGLYGPLLWYINQSLKLNPPAKQTKGRAADVLLVPDAEGIVQLAITCNETSITDGFASECGRFDVDPEETYGIPEDFARAMGIINLHLKTWQK